METFPDRLYPAMCLLLFALIAACAAPEDPHEGGPKGAALDGERASPEPTTGEGTEEPPEQPLPTTENEPATGNEPATENEPGSVEIHILIAADRPRTYGYRVNGQSVPDLTALGHRLGTVEFDSAPPKIMIRPARDVPYEQVVKVVNLCCKAGLNRITFSGEGRDR